MQKQIADFNALLAKNQLPEIKTAPTKLTDLPCSFMPEATRTSKK
jgi:hypothetical protein